MPSFAATGARLYYRLEGRPGLPRLLLLHPVGADHSLFDAVVPALLETHQVLRPDLRGHGGSQSPAAQAYRIEDLAGDVLALCDALGWSQFSVCGVSLGAMTALQMAVQAPTRVQALVICSAAARMPEPPAGGWDARITAAKAQGIATQAGGMVERMFSADFRATQAPAIGTFTTVFEQTDPVGYANCLAVLRDADLRPHLPQLSMPALVVNGSQDALIQPAAIEALTQGLPHARRVVLETGHFPLVEAPGAFVAAVKPFLAAGH